MESFNFINKFLSLSESSDGTKLYGTVVICPLDEANGNGVGIKRSDITDAEIQTLVGQPAVAKIIKNKDGDLDFGGHELKKIKEYNVETNKVESKYIFDTQPIGVFTKVWVEEIELDGINKLCILANVEFWTRYENSIKVITKLFDSNNLHTSWEISYSEKYVDEGVSWRKGIVFFGVAILGTKNPPAYSDSSVFELSELDISEELEEAFTEDIIKENQQKNNPEKSELNINETRGGNDMSEEAKKTKDTILNPEVSAITQEDLQTRIRKAMNSISNYHYYYISMVYPYDYRVIAYEYSNRESEEDFIEFTYTVNSDETISITSQKDVKMQFVAIDDVAKTKEEIAEKTTKIESLEKEVSEKNEAIIKLDTQIKEKDTAIAELQPFKEKIEKAELEVKEKEVAEKKVALKNIALKSKYITEEDIKTPEISELIENLDEKGIKAIIADRVMEKAEKEANEDKSKDEPKVETSEESNLENTEDSDIGESVMSVFLKRK